MIHGSGNIDRLAYHLATSHLGPGRLRRLGEARERLLVTGEDGVSCHLTVAVELRQRRATT